MRSFAFSGESRYLTRLQVYGKEDPTNITDLELLADKVDPNHHKLPDNLELVGNKVGTIYQKTTQEKIVAALKLLTFREQHVLVQFWSPHEWSTPEFGIHRQLKTIDQPFGFGVIDVRLHTYRKDSEGRSFDVNEDLSPAARVFRQGLPEWTSDLDNYTPKQFLQQECAIRCNLHGYLALPVFDLNTRICVGVLELLTSSKYKNYAYEVHQIHNVLKTQTLISPQRFDFPPSYVPSEQRQKDNGKIHSILKNTCDIYGSPLAQAWVVSQQTTFVSHEKVIEKSCSSFDVKCVGKVCMSTAAQPFYVKDLRKWPFREACRVRHVEKSRGFVGKVLSSLGSCFCRDVTKLDEEEYPLVQNARMHKLTSCFAIFLHSVEANDDYVLEFFLPPDIKDSRDVLSLVQILKQNIERASGFELGDSSCIQVVGPPTEDGKSISKDPHTIQISSITTTNNNKFEMVTSDSESIMVDIANKNESSANALNQWQSKEIYPADDFTQHSLNVAGTSKHNEIISYPNVSMQKKSENTTEAREKNNRLKPGRKPKINSLKMDKVKKHVGKPIEEAAKSLDVSRSTLKRFCRENGMQSWPLPKNSKKTVQNTILKLPQNSWARQNLQRSSNILFAVTLLMIRVKRWSCSIKSHGFSGKWWSCGKHRYLTHPAVSESTAKPKHTISIINPYSHVAESSLVHTSPKQTVANISDVSQEVTVKATFGKDMIRFQFPNSSGLLELEHEVARRIIKSESIESRRLRLKYRDEDNDLILLACDADLHNLLGHYGHTAHNNTIKLIIQMAED